ncbi:pyrimidine-specific ribonucleoside hydrolase RihA-like [Sabethes cyaneus]|uniref:pyrimidine-specific ribonucleoside hydrolase RihA-like n=1 Tax=Sabethes cyaneus TaxID=53552 RepID=UPI00237EE6F0|nr:pyrimidine-specific ribonucleoside hydrolase RihA-like [Sabethes cyaneus]
MVNWKLSRTFWLKMSLVMTVIFAVVGVLVVALGTSDASSSQSLQAVKRVIVDVDAGPDDAWAVFHLLSAESVRIEAISCVRGNTNATNVGRNVLRTLTALGRENDIPIYVGSNEPLITPAPEVKPEDMYFGSDGFSDIEFGEPHPNMTLLRIDSTFEELFKLIKKHRNDISFISLGPLTNLALLLKTYPNTRHWINEVFIMGGNRHGVGNTKNAAEFNFYKDPEAANIVINNYHRNITVLPWETASRDNLVMNQTWRFDVLGNTNNAVVKILNPVERKPLLSETDNWMPCDLLVAMAFTHPELITESKRYRADVELHGWLTRGQLVLDHANEGTGNVTIIDNMDTPTVKRMLLTLAGVAK